MSFSRKTVLFLAVLPLACGADHISGGGETVIIEVHCDLASDSACFVCPEFMNELQPTRDVESLKGEENLIAIDSYQLEYDWGEELQVVFADGVYRDLMTVSVPPGGRYTFCMPSLPGHLGEEVKASPFWDEAPAGQTTSFMVDLTVFGSTAGGRTWSQERLYRVVVGYGL